METSASLLDRLAAHPSDADWRRLFDLYSPLLRVWLARAGVPSTDADDLAQEVLLVVFREVSGFERRGVGAFRAWLRTILANRVRDYFRARQKRPTATGDSAFQEKLAELEAPGSALSQLWDREHDQHVARQLLKVVQVDFTPPTWRAFCRQVIDGAPAAQVADELGLSLNAVLLAKSRVLRRMRRELRGFVG
ncbi:MAG TPA: sigma-70 family RNA polymerase sigma factor [Gemmataceae bacterium]|jgi:RNA polymerase sigma-70 factor (ECF subfamily)|nr:sigma-70 family RNA polymerase sigma factor [Gemmataceae bacterium]